MKQAKHRHCRKTAVHPEHRYERNGVTYTCEGTPHNHDTHCCSEHKHHVTPHHGCHMR